MADTTVVPEKSGSPERVAYDLMYFLRQLLPAETDAKKRIAQYLDLYAECLDATKARRDYPGKP